MPHATSETTAVDAWRQALTIAHKRRIPAEDLEEIIQDLKVHHAASADDVTDIVLGLRDPTERHDRDPLIIRYVDLMFKTRSALPSAFLIRLLQQTQRFSTPTTDATVTKIPLPTFEEKLFLLIKNALNDRTYPGSIWKLHGIVFGLTRWLNAVSDFEQTQQLELGPLHTIDVSTASMYEALGLLAIDVFGNRHFKEIERQPWWKDRRTQIAFELNRFDLNILQWGHSQLAGHLHSLTTTRPFLPTGKDGKPTFSRDDILAVIVDPPPIATRTSMFIWLSACLSARSLPNNASINNYLLLRYHEDVNTAALSLILASFDVLSNASSGSTTIRSFICNKVPLLLSSFAVLVTPEMVEQCISMALISLNLEPGSPLGASAEGEIFRETRTDFIHACAMHSLLSENAAVSLLQNQPVRKIARYNKAALLAQCANNIGRLEGLINELEGMTGNVGAISACIVEMIRNLCTSKETMTLKATCAFLLKKISLMDFVLQYAQPSALLMPLWMLLNEWVHEQDQTEFQPPYEEFAVILLFTIAFVDRYGLDSTDIGLVGDGSFMFELLSSGTASSSLGDLTEEQKKQLANWIQGLYATDEHGETVGITDDVYAQCPPQAFYLLVPTLFEQTVLACRSRVLTTSIVKGGLEFLLEPFLMPSLIGGLGWIANSSWQDAEDTNIRLQILDKLLKPSNASQDVQSMHRAILAIVADKLVASLQRLLRLRPDKKKEIDEFVKILHPCVGKRRVVTVQKARFENWSGIAMHLQAKIKELAAYASQNASSAPRSYEPGLLWQAAEMLGPDKVLDVMIDEISQQEIVSSASITIDVCAAMICSPHPKATSESIEKLPVRDCLRCITDDEKALLDMPFKKAEALIRLSRKVQLQSGVSQLTSQMELASIALPDQDANTMGLGLTTTDASLDAAAAAIINSADTFENNGFPTNPTLNLEATTQEIQDMVADPDLMAMDSGHDIFGDLDLGLSNQTSFGTNAVSNDINADDDIFGDLDMTNLGDDDFTFT